MAKRCEWEGCTNSAVTRVKTQAETSWDEVVSDARGGAFPVRFEYVPMRQ